MERFQKGDSSEDVFKSLKFHQSAIVGGGMKSSETGYSPDDKALGKTKTGEGETGNEGLPEDFPMRHVFDKLGFKTVEDVQAKSFDDLVALDGIADASATKALAYGK